MIQMEFLRAEYTAKKLQSYSFGICHLFFIISFSWVGYLSLGKIASSLKWADRLIWGGIYCRGVKVIRVTGVSISSKKMANFIMHPNSYLINESEAISYLTVAEWPIGLQNSFIKNLYKVPYRFFIIDNR
jgi:hypothetical protein